RSAHLHRDDTCTHGRWTVCCPSSSGQSLVETSRSSSRTPARRDNDAGVASSRTAVSAVFRASLSAAAESTKKVPLSSSFLRFYFTFGPRTAAFPLQMALDGIRMPDGCYADGTWELKMHVTDLNRDVSLRVTGEIHVGGVMLKLVEKLAPAVDSRGVPDHLGRSHAATDRLVAL
ncbi:Fermitin family -like protein 2, partial [Takifugu flavidus]